MKMSRNMIGRWVKLKAPFSQTTEELFRLQGWRRLPMFIDGYVYLRWIHGYVKTVSSCLDLFKKCATKSNQRFVHPLIRFAVNHYHGKVTSYEDARKIIQLEHDLRVPSDVSETVIPFDTANHIIFRNPQSIVAIDCACRHAQKHNCEPAQRCMIIGEPFASFVLEHSASVNPRRLDRQEALDLLRVCHEKGYVHNTYFKSGVGNQNYAICNCDPECCISLAAHHFLRHLEVEDFTTTPSGYLAVIDDEKCENHGLCRERCPFGAIDKRHHRYVVDGDRCMGCGKCTVVCPESAISLTSRGNSDIPLDLDALPLEDIDLK